MPTRNRIILGHARDVAESADRVVGVASWGQASGASSQELERMVNAAVERVRRRFGNKYAKVARAYFKRKPWQKTGLPRRTFYHALKKVKDFFHADK